MEKYKVIGLMSGTSLDGVDLAACEFFKDKDKWRFTIHDARTFGYPPEWSVRLAELPSADALTFCLTHAEYGHFLGRLVSDFIGQTGFQPQLVASHGHTIFHQPDRRITVQIGLGSAIAAETGIPVACDFRSADVAMGGQGAPLVPIGDRLLFPEYQACLNLGGFANISYEKDESRIAFDICPVNIVLNMLASSKGLKFDENGELARSGKVDLSTLERLNSLEYYRKPPPKSLGREWMEQKLLPVLLEKELSAEDSLRTFCRHIAFQVNKARKNKPGDNILVTGGGAHNIFLMECIRNDGNCNYRLMSDQLTDFKEALVFAFLGLLRWKEENNILRSVTGSSRDHCGGVMYKP